MDVRLVVLDLLGTFAPPRKPAPEQAFDALLAASVASWAILGWTAAAGPVTLVRVSVCLLHLTVALAIARRARLEQVATPRVVLRAVPALVVAGLAFRAAAPLGTWPPTLELLFGFGAALAVLSFLSMGESFSVLPARRAIVSRGPYRLIRHPAYAGEVLMVVACALSRPSSMSLAALALVLPLVALRVVTEEKFLAASTDYRAYAAAVPYRVIPGLW